MIYEASTGLIHQPSAKLVNGLVLGLPSLIAVLLIAAALSGHSYSAAGKHPVISPARSAAAPTASHVSQPGTTAPASSASGSPAIATPSSSGASSTTPSTQSATTAPVTSGGLGGGSTTTSTSSSSSLLPATITTPSLDVQAAGKQILSTSPTSLTIN